MSAPVSIDRVVDMLKSRMPSLCAELLPAGHRWQNEWRVGDLAGNPSRHGPQGGSLLICLAGAKAGVWKDFCTGEAGDALDLIAGVLYRGNKADALAWAKQWLGLDSGAVKPPTRAEVKAREARDQAEIERQDAGRRAAAWRIWEASEKSILGTPVQAYLADRAIDPARLDFEMNALRFCPRLDHPEGGAYPAMVAIITSSQGKFLGVHRTWLSRDAFGVWGKAPVEDPKLSLGRYNIGGGHIRLWRGVSVDPATGEVKRARRLSECRETVEVHLTEGIEDGITVALEYPEARVLVAVSGSNMVNLRLPPIVARIVIWAQNEPPGSKGDVSLRKAVEQFRRQGRTVAVRHPPEGFKDVNDVVRDRARRQAQQASA